MIILYEDWRWIVTTVILDKRYQSVTKVTVSDAGYVYDSHGYRYKSPGTKLKPDPTQIMLLPSQVHLMAHFGAPARSTTYPEEVLEAFKKPTLNGYHFKGIGRGSIPKLPVPYTGQVYPPSRANVCLDQSSPKRLLLYRIKPAQ